MPVYANSVAIPRGDLSDVLMETSAEDGMFSGPILFPPLSVDDINSVAPKIEIGKGDLMRATRKRRKAGSHFDRWSSTISNYSFTLTQVAEEIQIPDEVNMTYDKYFDLESMYTLEAGERLRRGHEEEVAAELFDPANFPPTPASVNYTRTLKGTFNMASDINQAIRRLRSRGIKANTIAMAGPLFDLVKEGTLTQGFITGNLGAGKDTNLTTLGAAFKDQGITQFLALDSYVNVSVKDKADEIVPIFSNNYIFVGNVGSGNLRSGGIGRTFFWGKEGPLFNVSTYRDEPTKSNIIRAMKTTLVDVMNPKAGELILTNYSNV